MPFDLESLRAIGKKKMQDTEKCPHCGVWGDSRVPIGAHEKSFDQQCMSCGEVTPRRLWLEAAEGKTPKNPEKRVKRGRGKQVAVDLDGTLAHYDEDQVFDPQVIGDPVPEMVANLQQYIHDGYEPVLFTARACEPDNIPPIKAWLKKHKIPIKVITNQKTPEMSVFLDDRAVGVHINQGTLKMATESRWQCCGTGRSNLQILNPPWQGASVGAIRGPGVCLLCGSEFNPEKSKVSAEDLEKLRAFQNARADKEPKLYKRWDEEGVKTAFAHGEYKEALKDTNTDPTEAQKASGNYKKGRFDWHGLAIAVENPKGSIRRGISSTGKKWQTVMMNTYGYITNAPDSGADGDKVDVFIGNHPEHQLVGVVDQYHGDSFDEHKCVLGVKDAADAEESYLANYQKGWKGCGAVTLLTLAQFKSWLKKGDTGKPLAGQKFETFHKTAGWEKTHTKTLPDGRELDVLKLIELLQDREAIETPIAELKGFSDSRRSGFSDKRYEAADTAYPVIRDNEGNVMDGRHRLLKLQSSGATSASAVTANPEDIAAALAEGNKTAADGQFHRPENFDREKDIKGVPQNYHLYVGANDWENCGLTWAAIYPEWQEVRGNQPVRWLKIDHSNCPVCKGNADHNSGKSQTAREFATSEVETWLKGIKLERLEKMYGRKNVRAVAERLGNDLPGAETEKTANTLPEATTPPAEVIPTTGIAAIAHRLRTMDVEAIRQQAMDDLKSGKKTRRPNAVKLLSILEGLQRNKLTPANLLLTKVPVLPPQYRPYAVAGDTLIPGNENELYRDLMHARRQHRELSDVFGPESAHSANQTVYDSVKALMGYGEPVNAETKARGVTGFMGRILGSGPKQSWLMSKMIAKPVDTVGRSVISVNPDLNINQIGMPEDMVWRQFQPHLVRRMVQRGVKQVEAIKAVKARNPLARQTLMKLIETHPVVYSRAPAWHKFSVMSGYAKIVDGDAIQSNPYITTGAGADFDGNCVKVGTRILLKVTPKIARKFGLMSFKNNQKIAALKDASIHLINIENFPHGEFWKKDKNGADMYLVPKGVQVLSPSPTGMKWCDVNTFTIEKDVECATLTTASGHCVDISTNESAAVLKPETGELLKLKPSDAVGQWVPISRHIPGGAAVSITQSDEFELGWLLGAFVSDGWLEPTRGIVGFTKAEDAIRGRFLTYLNGFLGPDESSKIGVKAYQELHMAETNNGVGGVSRKIHIGATAGLCPRFDWLRDVLRDCYAPELQRSSDSERSCLFKRLPQLTWSLTPRGWAGLLSGLLDGDGCVSTRIKKETRQPCFVANFCTSSEYLRDSVMSLMQLMGVRTSFTVTKPSEGRLQTHESFTITMSVVDIKRLAPQLNLSKPNAASALNVLTQTGEMDDVRDLIPVSLEEIRALNASYKSSKSSSSWATSVSKVKKSKGQVAGLSRAWLRDLFFGEIPEGLRALHRRVLDVTTGWSVVVSADVSGVFDVYDICVPETKVFALANGLVVYDTFNIHVPATDDAIEEAKTRLLPSNSVFKIRNPDSVMPQLKHEQILGLTGAQHAKAKQRHQFGSEAEAMEAVNSGKISMSDEVEWPDPVEVPAAAPAMKV